MSAPTLTVATGRKHRFKCASGDQLPSRFVAGQAKPNASGLLYFATGCYELTDDDRAVVEQVVAEAAQLADHELELTIEGHADSRGEADDNQTLSDRRATETKKALLLAIENLPDGPSRMALKRSLKIDGGRGASPRNANQATQRRVDIFVRQLPGLFEAGLIRWNPATPDLIHVIGKGVTPLRVAVEIYGDELPQNLLAPPAQALDDGAELPVPSQLILQYPSLKPELKEKYDQAITILPRSSWHPRAVIRNDPQRLYQAYTQPLEEALNGIVVHHSGNSNMHTMAEAQSAHMDGHLKAADIGYHYGIDLQGQIFEGRPMGIVGSHVLNHNTGRIGIVLLADLDTENKGVIVDYNGDDQLTDEMRASLMLLIHWLRGRYPLVHTLGGHLEYAIEKGEERNCPGNLVMNQMETWRRTMGFFAPKR